MDSKISRRTLLKGATAAAAGTAAGAFTATARAATLGAAAGPETPYVAASNVISASPKKNIVETDSGKVFGYVQNGVITFQGVPYGASTAGRARYLPPTKPAPWAGVRSALHWGPVSPQAYTNTLDARRGGWQHDDESFMFRWQDGSPGEDCLNLNVWTPSVNDNAKRPVMVWIHGGGYTSGSSHELRMYPGDGLVRRGDVIVVSLNHRLGALGYANLMDFSPNYASSPNLGMLDLVAGLKWIQNNIANFGGDPGKVLLFGQSGGGAKISVLMGMPSAQGLFHRAVVESGSSLRQGTPESSARIAAAMVAELGLSKATIERIHQVSVDDIIQAAERAGRVASAAGAEAGRWGPVVDGHILPRDAFDPAAPSYSASVPLLVGNVYNEFYNSVQMGDPTLDATMTMADARQRLSSRGRGGLGADAGKVIQAFQAAHPHATPFEVFSVIAAASSMRRNALLQATRKAQQNAAPAYNYWFQWQTPVLDGRPRAYHCSELPFVFYQTETCDFMTGGGPGALKLGGLMADAWISFARNGDPNHAGLPAWPKFDGTTVPTMIFDNESRVVNDPDAEVRKAIDEAMGS